MCSGECVHSNHQSMPAGDTRLIMEMVTDTTNNCKLKREGSDTYITVTPAGELKGIVRTIILIVTLLYNTVH